MGKGKNMTEKKATDKIYCLLCGRMILTEDPDIEYPICDRCYDCQDD